MSRAFGEIDRAQRVVQAATSFLAAQGDALLAPESAAWARAIGREVRERPALAESVARCTSTAPSAGTYVALAAELAQLFSPRLVAHIVRAVRARDLASYPPGAWGRALDDAESALRRQWRAAGWRTPRVALSTAFDVARAWARAGGVVAGSAPRRRAS